VKIKGLVALTGASGSGKSAASAYLKTLGIDIIDGDVVARRVQQKGSPCLAALVDAFSEEILDDNGELNRKKLGSIVFADKEKLRLLNGIVHPFVVDAIVSEAKALLSDGKKYCIVEAPTLIESGLINYCDKVICVEAKRETSLERIRVRDGLSLEDASNRLSSQLPLETYRAVSDLVILNDGSLEDLYQKIDETVQTVNAWYQ